MLRFLTLGLVAATCGCFAAAILTSTACITAPPPQLPEVAGHRPTILHESVVPPTTLFLPALPLEFVVPVQLDDPNESFQWDVFVDYIPCSDPSTCQPASPKTPPGVVTVNPTPGTLDGRVEVVHVSPPLGLSNSECHKIDFVVAHQFNSDSHTWDSVGGDIVTWIYDPGGALPCPLLVYDAGSVQDGAFPPDAGSDGLPAVPESGTGDP